MPSVTDREHMAAIQSRDGVRGPHPAKSYRWACPCGDVGRWTRQFDTALTGALRHDERMGAL